MKFLFVVEEIAEISPICSTIVASAIGMIVMTAFASVDQSGSLKTSNAVFSILKGRPIQAASRTESKLTMPRKHAAIYETITPRRTGTILIMPFPKTLQTTTTRIARTATIQLSLQLSIAVLESVRPIAMMIGPVTTGGKNLMTLFCPNALIRAASTR